MQFGCCTVFSDLIRFLLLIVIAIIALIAGVTYDDTLRLPEITDQVCPRPNMVPISFSGQTHVNWRLIHLECRSPNVRCNCTTLPLLAINESSAGNLTQSKQELETLLQDYSALQWYNSQLMNNFQAISNKVTLSQRQSFDCFLDTKMARLSQTILSPIESRLAAYICTKTYQNSGSLVEVANISRALYEDCKGNPSQLVMLLNAASSEWLKGSCQTIVDGMTDFGNQAQKSLEALNASHRLPTGVFNVTTLQQMIQRWQIMTKLSCADIQDIDIFVSKPKEFLEKVVNLLENTAIIMWDKLRPADGRC